MNAAERSRQWIRRDGWLLAALLMCCMLCLAMGSSTGADSQEQRISRVLSAMEGAGQVELAICYADTTPTGAVAVADGAGSVAVQLRLQSALSTLLGLDASCVSIHPRQPR